MSGNQQLQSSHIVYQYDRKCGKCPYHHQLTGFVRLTTATFLETTQPFHCTYKKTGLTRAKQHVSPCSYIFCLSIYLSLSSLLFLYLLRLEIAANRINAPIKIKVPILSAYHSLFFEIRTDIPIEIHTTAAR